MGIAEMLKESLDSLSAKPLYAQLAAQIQDMIQSGKLKPGELLPSEPELCESVGISRSTVRQAFSHLEEAGFVVRRRGKGTYVSIPKVLRPLSRLCSFTRQMAELGITSTSKVLELQVLTGDDESVPFGLTGEVYKIVRMRQTDGRPFMVDTAFVPVYLAPGLTKEALENRSLYDVIEQMTDYIPHYAHESYEVVKLSREEAVLLDADEKAAFLVKRVTRMKTGELFEIASMLIRGDRCRLKAELEPDAVVFSRQLQQ
jgi:GntR family transcriptional regulator